MTYKELAEVYVRDMVLVNEIATQELEIIQGDLEEGDDVFQFFIVQNPDYLLHHTHELIFYNALLDVYVWGITHWGTDWGYVEAHTY